MDRIPTPFLSALCKAFHAKHRPTTDKETPGAAMCRGFSFVLHSIHESVRMRPNSDTSGGIVAANPGMKESVKSAAEHIAVAPPVIITSTTFFGVTFQNWVYILTAIYTLFHIIRYIPKIITCFGCFVTKHKCDNACKIPPNNEELI